MSGRALAWVGTVPPGASTTDTSRLRWLLDRSRGTRVLAIPCDRDQQWIIDYLRSLADEQGEVFDAYVPGDYRGYRSFRVHRLRPHARIEPRHVALGRTTTVPAALSKLKALRQVAGHPHVPLQVSWPAPLDRTLFTFAASGIDPRGRARTLWAALRRPVRLWRALRYLPVFIAADRDEFTSLIDSHGNDLVLQLESPGILLAIWATPRWLRPLVADRLARHTAHVIASVPHTATITLHLCYGNLNDENLHAPSSLHDHVRFLNRLADHLAARARQLPTVHIPAAYGSHPPPTDPAFYAPLRDLHRRYNLIAGVVDEHEPITSAAALVAFEHAAGRQAVAVATTCGLGRHTDHDADLAALVMRALTDPTATPATLTRVLMETLAAERLASTGALGHHLADATESDKVASQAAHVSSEGTDTAASSSPDLSVPPHITPDVRGGTTS